MEQLFTVTDLVEPDLEGYFALPGGIFTSLAPGGFLKTPWCRILVSLLRRAPLQKKVTRINLVDFCLPW